VFDKPKPQVSRTALGSAYLRAAHVRDDPPPWILEDDIAARLLGAHEIAELEGGGVHDAAELSRQYLGSRTDLRLPGSTIVGVASV
jgi:O-methyltransferase involved in polyketide biosynthesis